MPEKLILKLRELLLKHKGEIVRQVAHLEMGRKAQIGIARNIRK